MPVVTDMHSEDFSASPSPPSLWNVVNVSKHVLKFTRLLIVDMAEIYCSLKTRNHSSPFHRSFIIITSGTSPATVQDVN